MTINYKGYNCDICVYSYVNNRMAIVLEEEGEPIIDVSLNLPEYYLENKQIFIKQEEKELIKSLTEEQYIEFTGKEVEFGNFGQKAGVYNVLIK